MTFAATNEVLLQIDEYQSVRYVMEARVSKPYMTALEALGAIDHDTTHRFILLDVQTLETLDVTEDMAKAYITKFEPDGEEHVPPFVETSIAYADHIDDMEGPVDAQREWGTWNREQTGVRG